jgi:hypothetical protein
MQIKNSEEIRKQMKPVISMQQIISPSSHNQSNAVGLATVRTDLTSSNVFAKTFHNQPTPKLMP